MEKKKIIGIGIFVLLTLLIIGIKVFSNKNIDSNLTTIYVATGGGKEDFLKDEEVQKIFREKYKINVVFDTWSNGKTVTKPLIRESINLGNEKIINSIKNGSNVTINTSDVTKYDALFTSDQRFYDYYKLQPNKENGESDRYTVLEGGLTLNTPIVVYSWKKVVNCLIKENIVTEIDGVYYITDMEKLMNYILNGKKWKDIGLDELYGNINISSTDPVSSSPGATYYGLLLSILSEGEINDENLEKNLSKLKEFYKKSGYMNNTPADLFERYLKTGMGGEPMIVDYEKSIIDFANSNEAGFNQVKDEIVILYPKPTIWNSHCLAIFSENGKKLYEAINDSRISQIAWEKYGFRTGVTGGVYDVSKLQIGIPNNINSTVTSLKMDYYNKLIDYLKK
ncbi:MAG: hypothetical protein KIC82_00580 [Acholeplasma sp.]|nr:hypothetical protein [Acholeplasma sp.]CCY28191.1 putative uncharacterized protein [Acholeplasma sp. CAG:878]